MGPCIVSQRGGIPRVIEGHRGSSRVLVWSSRGSYRVWLALFWKGFHREIILFRNKSNFTGKFYSLGILKVISPGNHPFKPKPAIPYSFLLSFIQGPSMTLDVPRNASSWANNTRTHGLLKSIPLIQSISPWDLDIYHLYGRSISSITSHTVKNFSKLFKLFSNKKNIS